MKANFCFIKIFIVAFLFILLQSCSNKTSFQTSSIVPAAEGSVKVRNDRNNNYVIDLDVIRLAEPERLSPPKQIYVVWIETEQNEMKNIGQLRTSTGFLSKTLKSSLETVSPFKPKEILITAEDDPAPNYPSYVVVLRTGPL